jgi:hypothetical protein
MWKDVYFSMLKKWVDSVMCVNVSQFPMANSAY